jgi:hypothetical protein
MALVSPGVEVNVIDESFYTPAAAGTVPMIFVASAENKPNSSGTGIAEGTRRQNAGVPFLLTSQRDLSELFGDPVFQTDNNNNPVNGSEINEYGLQAAYSVLGVTNRAWVTRADIDLGALQPTAVEPASDPIAGTYWLDTEQSAYGVFEWNSAPRTAGGQRFTRKTPIVVLDTDEVTFGTQSFNGTTGDIPKGSIGAVGNYALVFTSAIVRLFYKNRQGTWVLVGSEQWAASFATVTGSNFDIAAIDGSTTFTINGTTISFSGPTANIDEVVTEINSSAPSGITAVAVGSDDSTAYIELISTGAWLTITGGSVVGITDDTYYPVNLQISKHTEVPEYKLTDPDPRPTGSVWIKTTEPGGGARWRMKVYNDATEAWDEIDTPLYADNAEAIFELDRTGGGAVIPNGAVYVQYNAAEDTQQDATFKLFKRNGVAPTTYTTDTVGTVADGTYEGIEIRATQPAFDGFAQAVYSFDLEILDESDPLFVRASEVFAAAVNSSGITGLSASVSNDRITLTHATGGDIRIQDSDTAVLTQLGFNADDKNISYVPGTDANTTPLQLQISLWNATLSGVTGSEIFYTASNDEVTTLTADGTLWYNSVVDEVDIMVHNGTTWVGYKELPANAATDPAGPIVSASRPTAQSTGDDLVTGDIWIDTSDINKYPEIYVYDAELELAAPSQRWLLRDNTDQTSENGVLFADARWSTDGGNSEDPYPAAEISELLNSSYLDPDAPDPALYPRGMLLFNLRRSGFNVKRFVRGYIDTEQDNERFNDSESMAEYYPHRWVTESANQPDGSGSFGSAAQRKVVVQSLQEMLNSNEEIRDTESRRFNLMAVPGYSELIGEMITLNFDRRLSSFIVGDSPATLEPGATALNTWGTNENNAVEDNLNGLVSRDEYMAVFYPWGFTSDNFGNNVVVPPSHMILRTMILSDQVSFPWFAPAGTRRGGITNASSVGYINNEGEFRSIALNEGQRDVLYENNVNPITFLSGAGLVNFGQKTRARGASALDRINVARLVIFMRQQLNLLAKPFIFEQNDKITRDEIKQATESFLLELVGQRALNDFLVVCDESNNTPSRIDRNELYLDIAIEPVKAVEFIFIPLRLKNTGEIAAL